MNHSSPLGSTERPFADGLNGSPRLGDAAASVFAFGWALGTLFDKGWYGHWQYTPSNYLLLATTVSLLALPGRSLPLLAYVLAQLLDYFADPSVMGNHLLLHTFGNAAILGAFAVHGVRHRALPRESTPILALASPAICWLLIWTYTLATLHKLNYDFLAPDLSCACYLSFSERNQPLPLWFVPQSTWANYMSIYATLIIEGLIPILLAVPRYRGAGILSSLYFHSFLSSGPRNGFYAFGVIIFPMLALFSSEQSMARLQNWFLACRNALSPRRPGTALPMLLGLAALAYMAIRERQFGVSRTFPFWITYDLILCAFGLTEWRRSVRSIGNESPVLFRLGSPIFRVHAALFILNGLCPYLGLKTETSFAMYSNLRTEGNVTNHLFIPVATQVFDFQRDLVEVTDSSVPELRKLAKERLRVPYFELRRQLSVLPEASVTFHRGEQVHEIARVADRRDVLPEVSLLLQRIMPFRPVDMAERQQCRH